MGRIKGTLIKRSTKDLLNVYSNKFSTDFDQNKKAVSGILPTLGKKLRNSIAGYITRIVKRQSK